MLPNRLRISKRSTDALKMLKGRTGLTPNILCRIALALSIREKPAISENSIRLDGAEFSLSTMLGEHANLYECVLREMHGELTEAEAQKAFAAHVDIGVERLRRVKNIGDILTFN
jgi:DNA sulfur modification protein DndE